VFDAAANPAVVGKHGAAVGGELVRRPIGGRARTSAIRALLDFAGGSGIAAIRLDRMHGRRAARNTENAEGEPATCRKPDSDRRKAPTHFSLPSRKGNRCCNRPHQLRASARALRGVPSAEHLQMATRPEWPLTSGPHRMRAGSRRALTGTLPIVSNVALRRGTRASRAGGSASLFARADFLP
jgi:hypothetical protein